MRVEGQWPDTELAVLAWLRDRLADDGGPAVVVRTELSAQFTGLTVLVERGPGGGGTEYEGEHHVDVTAFGPTRVDVWALVRRIETAMVELPGRGAVMIDAVQQRGAFGIVPYKNPELRRAVSTYALTSRPQ